LDFNFQIRAHVSSVRHHAVVSVGRSYKLWPLYRYILIRRLSNVFRWKITSPKLLALMTIESYVKLSELTVVIAEIILGLGYMNIW